MTVMHYLVAVQLIIAIIISIGCYLLWDFSNSSLFTFLGEVEIDGEIEKCYTYDTMTLPARIVAFLCGVFAIILFWLTWFSVYGIIFL